MPEEMAQRYDNVLFDVISGLVQAHKLVTSAEGAVPGPTVAALAARMKETKFFGKLLKFGTRVTYFVEHLLQSGMQIPLFRLSCVKVLWRAVDSLVHSVLEAPFIPGHSGDANKFLLDVAASQLANLREDADFQSLNAADKAEVEQLCIEGSVNTFKNDYNALYFQICQALFGPEFEEGAMGDPGSPQPYVLAFLNRYCHRAFFNLALRLFDNL